MIAFNVVIPARYQSTRLPGKVLLALAGKPMIYHVYQRAKESGAENIIIAVDDERVASVARDFGAEVCMTSQTHTTATDRLTEVVKKYQWADDTIVVNLQGDEPLMTAELVQQVASDLANNPASAIATLGVPIEDSDELFDPNIVKVVRNQNAEALYFSRAVIPWHRDQFVKSTQTLPDDSAHLRHLGLYAYRCHFLRKYSSLEPVYIEKAEMLEQLRALAYGYRIYVGVATQIPGHGVDTLEDLKKVETLLMSK